MSSNKNSMFILVFIILIFILLILISLLYVSLKSSNSNNENAQIVTEEKATIESVIQDNESEFLSRDGSYIYISCKYDLYGENGTSNKKYFDKLINELNPFFEDREYYIVDNEKSFKIHVKYDYELMTHIVLFNDIEDFYSKIDGKSYIAVDTIDNVPYTQIYIKDKYMDKLVQGDTFFTKLKDTLDDGVETNNKYTNYLDGTLSIRTAPNGIVKNMVYKDGYQGEDITKGVKMGTPLSKIYSLYKEPAFGSVEEEYLGYRTNSFYIFYYKDEISFYSYAYERIKLFENALEKYLESNNLNEFVIELTSKMKNYDYMAYDSENNSFYIIYASRGIEININNSTKEITLYNNYYFTDKTKSLVKNGSINLNSEEDLINVIEAKRRNNTLNFN